MVLSGMENLRMGECWAKRGSSLKRESLREVSLYPQTMIRASLVRGRSTSTIKHFLSPNYLGRAKHPFHPFLQPRPPALKIKHHHHQTNFLTKWLTVLPGLDLERMWTKHHVYNTARNHPTVHMGPPNHQHADGGPHPCKA